MAVAMSALPFILTFLVVAFVVSHKLFPILSGNAYRKAHHEGSRLPGSAPRERPSILSSLRPSATSAASIVFSSNFALSAVLVELILCEISNTVNRATRTLALKVTLPSLLFLLVIATPALEIHSIISGTGLNFGGQHRTQRRAAWALELFGLTVWLVGFWYLGRGLLGSYLHEESYEHNHTVSQGCLERIGIIGISLMASLAGFAAISALWQTFGVRYRPVSLGPFQYVMSIDTNYCRSLSRTSRANKLASKRPTICSSLKKVGCAQLSVSCQTTRSRALWAA